MSDWTCPHGCKKTFGTQDALRQHMRDKHDEDLYVCVVCHESFSREEDLTRHSKYKHAQVPCPHCRRPVGTVAGLQAMHT